MSSPLEELITSFYELNGSTIQEYYEDPSPLEFMRHVSQNIPFVIRNGASEWKATATWTPEFLETHLGDHLVNVAITPNGKADAPTIHDDGRIVFAKPYEEKQRFREFLRYIVQQEINVSDVSEIRYAQTQNDNLRHEYSSLFSHVPKSIPFAHIALGREPEAINLWIGQKHFVLLPSLCFPCVNEKFLAPATYSRKHDGTLELVPDDDSTPVPCATWDPDVAHHNCTPYTRFAKPITLTLSPGDILYLPAMWSAECSKNRLSQDAEKRC